MPMLRPPASLLLALGVSVALAACGHVPPTGGASDDDPMVVRGSATVGARTTTPAGTYLGR